MRSDAPAGAAALPADRARVMEQRVLDQRARAVREGDLKSFLRHVDRSDKPLRARQRRLFRNLEQLPWRHFGYRVLAEQWAGERPASAWGADVRIPRILEISQLDGFDAVPVRRPVALAFSFDSGRPVIVSDRTRTGKLFATGELPPWELARITVRREAGVLAIFDDRTRGSAELVTRVVREGIRELAEALPFGWDEHVVVYHFARRGLLDSFRDVPGGVIAHLGAMTFPTYAGEERGRIASTRMLLMPSSVHAGQPFLGRITRHELSHVAVGSRDDGAPAWVSEGLAEYLGARPLSAPGRIIPTAALARAAQRPTGMPPSAGFNGQDQEWHYALSWMAFDYLAATRGEARLWQLVQAMHAGGRGTRDDEQDAVLQRVVGMDSAQLARHAAERIRRIYG